MRLNLIHPRWMPWLEGYLAALSAHEVVVSATPAPGPFAARVFLWGDEVTQHYISTEPKDAKYVVYVRRYEHFSPWLQRMAWERVDAVVCVNTVLADRLAAQIGRAPTVLYNGVRPEQWRYAVRGHGTAVAVVGYLNQKKNLPLAMQILAQLPKTYTLHVAGGVQDAATLLYLEHLAEAMERRVYFYGQIPHAQMDAWLEDKAYLLSCAISEGCPNHVLEAMAKGIKPVVHAWPGAAAQFGPAVFATVAEAVAMLHPSSPYTSETYRAVVETAFGWSTFEAMARLVEDTCAPAPLLV